MTKFPNPFELLNRNLEDMQNINDAKNIGNTAKYKAPGIATDAKNIGNTVKDKAPGIASDLAGDFQDEAISLGQKVKNSKYVDYIYPLVVVILTFLGNWFVYSNTFGDFFKEKTINKKNDRYNDFLPK